MGLEFVHSTARLRDLHINQAWFWPEDGMYKAATQEKKIQVGNFAERGNEQITPQRGEKTVWNVKNLYLDDKIELDYAQVKEPHQKSSKLKCS